MTIDDFLRWSERQPSGRYELVDGLPLKMASERLRHNRVKRHLTNVLARAITQSGLPCEAVADGMAVPIQGKGTREPDALVTCGPPLDDDVVLVQSPVIVVEVLSPSTAGTDAWDKVEDYLAVPSIDHYLIVDPLARKVVHHWRAGKAWAVTEADDQAVLQLDPPGLRLAVAELLSPAPRV